MKLNLILPALLLSFACASQTQAATYQVGANRADKTLKSVLPRLKAGDVVEIDAGTYKETALIQAQGTREAPIVIRGVGAQRPVFDAEGIDTSGRGSIPRGVFQIEGSYINVEHLEFKNARNKQNSAGIRLNDSTMATIRDCKVTYCDMGIFGSDKETALIEGCEVAFNGTVDHNGGSHNFYMLGNRVVVRRCYMHDSLFGQNYKSRAHFNELWFNWITDSQEGEVGIVDGVGNTDRPNSNSLLVGNTIISKAQRGGNTSKYVLFGSEMPGGSHNGTLFLFHNTFIAGDGRVNFIALDDPQASAVIQGNVFIGSDQILRLAKPALSVQATQNLLPASAKKPEGWSDAPARALEYVDGEGQKRSVPMSEIAAR